MHLPLSVKYWISIYKAWLCQKNWLDFTWCWFWQLLNPGILQTVKLQSWPWWPTFHISWQRYEVSPCVFVALECVESSLNIWMSHMKSFLLHNFSAYIGITISWMICTDIKFSVVCSSVIWVGFSLSSSVALSCLTTHGTISQKAHVSPPSMYKYSIFCSESTIIDIYELFLIVHNSYNILGFEFPG